MFCSFFGRCALSVSFSLTRCHVVLWIETFLCNQNVCRAYTKKKVSAVRNSAETDNAVLTCAAIHTEDRYTHIFRAGAAPYFFSVRRLLFLLLFYGSHSKWLLLLLLLCEFLFIILPSTLVV